MSRGIYSVKGIRLGEWIPLAYSHSVARLTVQAEGSLPYSPYWYADEFP
jgi:hypothetical protein